MGLSTPDSGSVSVVGKSRRKTNSGQAAEIIGYVPQHEDFDAELSIKNNLLYHGGLQGLKAIEAARESDRVLEMFGLQHLASRRPADMSGGQRRACLVARGLMGSPRLLLLDEPTVGLDVSARDRVLQLIRTIADKGVAVLLTSHLLSDIGSLCESVVLLGAPAGITQGSVREVTASLDGFEIWEVVLSDAKDRLRLLAGLDRAHVRYRLSEAGIRLYGNPPELQHSGSIIRFEQTSPTLDDVIFLLKEDNEW